MMVHTRSLALALTYCFLALLALAPAQTERWDVRPTYQYQKSTIAVVRFNNTDTALETETLPRIIRNDLDLSGLFQMPPDQLKVNRQNLIDHRRNSIDWDFWRGEKIDYYCMGSARQQGNELRVNVLVYDIASRRQVLNREFSGTVDRLRDLAHQISDAIILQLKGIEGVCRTKLLFVTEQAPGVREIAIMDWDGFDARKVTNFGSIATGPVWGANGTEMYFTAYQGNRARIYGMQLLPDGAMKFHPGQMWTIASYGGTNHSPAWSNTARRVAMVLSRDGNSEIYTAGRDGKGLLRLTRTRATEGSPTWSPDGSQVAYTSNESGAVHLYLANADGSNKRRITSQGSWNDAVSWSPDGRRLAFVSRRQGVNDIYLFDLDQDSVRRLTMNQGNNESPAWAPNGTHIAFSSDRSGRYQIYLMLDDGSNQRPLTNSGRNTMPDWSPMFN